MLKKKNLSRKEPLGRFTKVLAKLDTAKWNQPTYSDLELSDAGRWGDVTRGEGPTEPGAHYKQLGRTPVQKG